MSETEHDRRWPLARRIGSWEIWTTPRAMRAYVLVLEVLVIALALALPLLSRVTGIELARAGLIMALAVGFEDSVHPNRSAADPVGDLQLR